MHMFKKHTQLAKLQSQPDDETAWVGIQNPAEYHIKGNGHTRAHTQGEKVSGL